MVYTDSGFKIHVNPLTYCPCNWINAYKKQASILQWMTKRKSTPVQDPPPPKKRRAISSNYRLITCLPMNCPSPQENPINVAEKYHPKEATKNMLRIYIITTFPYPRSGVNT